MNKEDQHLVSIYKDAFPQVAKLLHRLGADLPTARDIFHDAMVIYLERRRDNSVPHAVAPAQYIAGIARICWFKQCRQQRTVNDRTVNDIDNVIASQPSQDQKDPEKKSRLLWEYLQTAGASCMRLLQAFYYEGLSMSRIAEKFNYRSTRSATVQKYKCLEKLRDKVKNTEIYEETVA